MARRVVVPPNQMSCALRFLMMDETQLAAVAYVGAAAHDDMGYHLISVEKRKGVASYAGMLVESETVVASCVPLESDGMEENPYHHHRHHHHPFYH